MPETNPFSTIGTNLAAELARSRESAEKGQAVEFGKQADDMAAVRKKLDPQSSTPAQRAVVLENMRRQYSPEQYKVKLRQLLQGWSPKRGG